MLTHGCRVIDFFAQRKLQLHHRGVRFIHRPPCLLIYIAMALQSKIQVLGNALSGLLAQIVTQRLS